ncbi:MAG TPA: FHA domain-containing protein, partial [Abditibacteriaceae bacterium]
GVLIYLPETVDAVSLGALKNQTVEVRGIISHFQGTKKRYRFTTDDGASVLVIGDFPPQGGVSYYLRARVVEDAGKLALSEIAKQLEPFGTRKTPRGVIDDPNAPLIIGGSLLILAAIGTLGAMTMRNKAAEQKAALEKQLASAQAAAQAAQQNIKPPVRGGNGVHKDTVPAPGVRPPDIGTIASSGTIRVESGPNAPMTKALLDGETRVGRKKEERCWVLLDKDAAVSSHHGSIIMTKDRRLIYEDKSSNGSTVDGQFVQRAQREIKSGSTIKIGASTLVVELSAPPAPPSYNVPAVDAAPANASAMGAESAARNSPTVNIQMPAAPVASASSSASSAFNAAPPTSVGFGAEFEVVEGPEKGRRFPITKAVTTIGREERDILLTDITVSRRHATLTVREGKFILSDDSSAHGTRLNGNHLPTEGGQLHNGDRVIFGNKTQVVFHCIG